MVGHHRLGQDVHRTFPQGTHARSARKTTNRDIAAKPRYLDNRVQYIKVDNIELSQGVVDVHRVDKMGAGQTSYVRRADKIRCP